jgi:hypothetical protein
MGKLLELSGFLIIFLFGISLFAQSPIKDINKISAVPKLTTSSLPQLNFLEQAENVEREAWWLVTGMRVAGMSSPFRVLRAASATAQKGSKLKINFKFCKSLIVVNQAPEIWRFESACQKPSVEIGLAQRLTQLPEKWKISWKSAPFSDHFGLSTGILFTQQSCEFELDVKRRISRMSCPGYVRDRKLSEIVEFKIFEFRAQAPKVLKVEGEIKKDLQIMATFSSEVPITGDILLKVKKIQQKPVEVKTDFSNMVAPVPRVGDPHGNEKIKNEKEHENNFEKEDEEKIGNEKINENQSQDQWESGRHEEGRQEADFSIKRPGENQRQKEKSLPGEEDRNEEKSPGSNYEEVPAIEGGQSPSGGPAPSR